jgi:hypothetical protein
MARLSSLRKKEIFREVEILDHARMPQERSVTRG